MAKEINLLNNAWQTKRDTSTIKITANSSYVEFDMGDVATNERAWAKACIQIDASKYETIKLNVGGRVADYGSIWDLEFGVYDNMTPSSSSGKIGITSDRFRNQESIIHSCTLDISDMTGTKYVGFRFYGNTRTINYDEDGYACYVYASIDINGLTAVERSYNIVYYANGGSGIANSQVVDAGSSVILNSNTFTAPTSKVWTLTLDGNGGNDGSPTFKGNYFNKWRDGSASGTAYSEGDSYTPSKDTIMYAWWGTNYTWGSTTRDSIVNEGYTVTFDANGGICDTDFLTSKIITSYDFLGWGNSANNPTSIFKSDVTYKQTSNYTAYAIWSPPITTNGSITLPTPTRNGYEFLGWSTDKFDTNGATVEYAPDREGIVLYAIWKPMGNVYIYDNTGDFNPYQVLIYDSSGWNQYIPYIYTESGWEMYSG